MGHVYALQNPPKKSAESNGVTCSGCGIRMPANNYNFDHIYGNYCFYERATSGVVGSFGFNGYTPNVGVQVTKGEKLYKYFRVENMNAYYCTDCYFSKAVTEQQKRELTLALAGKGVVVSIKKELVKRRWLNNTIIMIHILYP